MKMIPPRKQREWPVWSFDPSASRDDAPLMRPSTRKPDGKNDIRECFRNRTEGVVR